LRGEGWGEGAKEEKTQEPIMSMYNQVAIKPILTTVLDYGLQDPCELNFLK
jgi:hypothetical protein